MRIGGLESMEAGKACSLPTTFNSINNCKV